MTACLEDIDEHYEQIKGEYLELAVGRGVPLMMVDLKCEESVNMVRLGSEERRHGVKRKLVDEGILKEIRRELRMMDVRKLGNEVCSAEIDVTRLGVEVATERICGYLNGVGKVVGRSSGGRERGEVIIL